MYNVYALTGFWRDDVESLSSNYYPKLVCLKSENWTIGMTVGVFDALGINFPEGTATNVLSKHILERKKWAT